MFVSFGPNSFINPLSEIFASNETFVKEANKRADTKAATYIDIPPVRGVALK